MVRFEIRPMESTAIDHIKRVYGAMFDDTGKAESVTLEGWIADWNVNGLIKMVQIMPMCAIHIECDDGILYIQRYNDGSAEVEGKTKWFTVKVTA